MSEPLPPATIRRLDAPEEVGRIARRLEGAGFETWAVGGAVRDALVGLHPKDWDLTTAARPGDVRRLFKRTIPIGIEHGTVGVLGKDGRMYEVTTFRRDVETDGRHARVVFADRLEEDLDRRDFTMNAVAWHPVTGEVRDPHGGLGDLEAGVLRTVGDPTERFTEDRLRVLRALRFAGRFGLRVEESAWGAARAMAPELTLLSAERIREELLKVLAIPDPRRSLHLYRESGVLRVLYDDLDACAGVIDERREDVWDHQVESAFAVSPGRPVLRLAALLHDIGKPYTIQVEGAVRTFHDHAAAGAARARALLTRRKSSNADTDRIAHLIAHHEDLPAPEAPDPEVRRWIRGVGREFLPDLFRLLIADRRARGGDGAADVVALWRRTRRLLVTSPALAVSDLAIGGGHLRRLGIPPGRLYGEILRDLLERVTDDPSLNTEERLMEIVRAGKERG